MVTFGIKETMPYIIMSFQAFKEEHDFCQLYKFKSGQKRIIVHSNPSVAKPSPVENGTVNGDK